MVLAPSALGTVQHTTDGLIKIASLDRVSTCTAVGPRTWGEGTISLRWRHKPVRGWCMYRLRRVFLYRWSGSFGHNHLRCSGFLLPLGFVHLESRFLLRCECEDPEPLPDSCSPGGMLRTTVSSRRNPQPSSPLRFPWTPRSTRIVNVAPAPARMPCS